MFIYALIVFAIAAAGGLVLAAHVLRNKFAPWFSSLLHAGLGGRLVYHHGLGTDRTEHDIGRQEK